MAGKRPPTIVVRQQGAAKAAADLARVGQHAADIRPARREIALIFQREERYRFALSGPRWKKLSPRTVELKAKRGSDPQILRATGALERSLVTDTGETPSPTKITFGSDVFYGRFHQYGTKRMPKRALIAISKPARAEIVDVLERYIAEPTKHPSSSPGPT